MNTRFRLVTLALLGIALVLGSAPARADEEVTPSWNIGLGLGGGFPDDPLVGDGEAQHFNFLYGLRGDHLFNDHWGIFADAIENPLEGDVAHGDGKEQGVQAGLQYIFNPNSFGRFFVAAGGGRAWYKPDASGVPDFDGWRASLGFGQRFAVAPNARLQWEIRGLQTMLDETDPPGDDLTNIQALLSFNWGTGGTPADTDGDGVRDKKDKCPDTPRGATVDATGCPKDSDGDGVFDGIDKCPNTPRGTKVDATGCPLDSDGDGVTDDKDRCPDTPRGTQVDANGCPPPPPPPPPAAIPERGQTLVLEGVNFDFNSDHLTAGSAETLDRVAASLVANADARIEVDGHTDSKGNDSYNQKLSARRAEAVKAYLVGKGVNASQLTTKGYGEKQPVASNDTEEGRAQNRRVELKRLD